MVSNELVSFFQGFSWFISASSLYYFYSLSFLQIGASIHKIQVHQISFGFPSCISCYVLNSTSYSQVKSWLLSTRGCSLFVRRCSLSVRGCSLPSRGCSLPARGCSSSVRSLSLPSRSCSWSVRSCSWSVFGSISGKREEISSNKESIAGIKRCLLDIR